MDHLETGMPYIEMLRYFRALYGPRNAKGLPNLLARAALLNIGVNDLEEAIRKDEDTRYIEVALARVQSRIFCVADWLNDDNLIISQMIRKYPLSGCVYCGRLSCQCGEKRSKAKPTDKLSEIQFEWSLESWSILAYATYGKQNIRRGVHYCLGRLYHEVAEIEGPALRMFLNDISSLDLQAKEEIAFEIADLQMWTIAVARLLNVELEQVTIRRYGQRCWSCQHFPCDCSEEFNTEPVNWKEVQTNNPDHLK